MKIQVLAGDRDTPPSGRWFTKRSRAARVLLFGWLLFWLAGIVQPCCVALAGVFDDDNTISQTVSAERGEFAGLPGTPHTAGNVCTQAFSADTAVLGHPSLLPAKADHTPHVAVISHFEPLLAASDLANSFDLYHASTPPRIYLRTQRLLI